MGLHDQNLINFIGQHFVQHPEHEDISLCQLVQVGEQLGAGKTPVAGEDAVGALPANGQAGPFQVPHGDLQDRFLRPVIDGQRAINAGDFNIAHDAEAGHVQEALVFFLLGVAEQVGIVPIGQRCVVAFGCGPDFVILVLVQVGDLYALWYQYPPAFGAGTQN